jgi:signal recognition particle subunit SEC65
MKDIKKFDEDEQIIGTPRYETFQQMCREAGLFAIKEARDKGLPITYVENDEIIKEYADGKIEVLGKVKPKVKVDKSVYTIE